MRKLKLYFWQLSDLNIDYCGYWRIKKRGWLYRLTKPLTPEQKVAITQKYQNVELYTHSLEYAPEIKTSAILLLDRCK